MSNLNALPVSELTTLARQHDALYRAGSAEFNPAHGHELWRRAVVDGCQEAWFAVYQIHKPQVRAWILRGRAVYAPVADLVNDTFAKFWRFVSAESFVEKMPVLGAVLSYLRLTARSVLADYLRQFQREDVSLGDWRETRGAILRPVESRYSLVSYRAMLRSEQERVVFDCLLVGNMTSAEVARVHSAEFGSAVKVYRCRENLLKRMRRQFCS